MFVSKRFRIFSFLLSVLFLLPVFSVNVSAASDDNLINPHLNEWTIINPDVTSIHPSASSSGELYLLRIYGLSGSGINTVYAGGAYDLSNANLTIGNPYKLSFYFPDPDRYVSSSTGSASFRGNGTLSVGLASYVGGELTMVPGYYFTINKDNFDRVKDTSIEFSFEMPSGVVNPCICFYYVNVDDGSNTVCIYLKDMKFTDVQKEKDDSFFSSLFEWFQEKFDNISNSFSDLKDSFIGKIQELKDGLQNKLNEVKEGIQSKIDELKQSFIDLKNDLLEGIKGLFVPSEDEITAWKAKLEKLLSDNLGFIYQIPKLFEDIVTKLKTILIRDDFSYSFKLPSFTFKLFGYDVLLWEAETVDFASIFEVDTFKTLYDIYTVCVNIIFGFALVKYGWQVLEELMSN